MKNTIQIPNVHHSDILDDFLSTISTEEFEETTSKMKIAAYIADAMKAKGINKTTLAKLLNQKNSVITKWLSGTHNFTTDTLDNISKVLDITLIANYNEAPVLMDKKEIKNEIPYGERNYKNRPLSNFSFAKDYEII
ncbi:helix-turn-helix transcriptional regulator [Myroides sp. N17-2]|uniref:helix-turn-helix domain-containing protein n=1 Tax=Myroides sp. N17-2 TaxID=2030799 RepID=UPI000EFB8467|nr:helix-turn-helix transcriptional regulator [Myroides sp. N17-2]